MIEADQIQMGDQKESEKNNEENDDPREIITSQKVGLELDNSEVVITLKRFQNPHQEAWNQPNLRYEEKFRNWEYMRGPAIFHIISPRQYIGLKFNYGASVVANGDQVYAKIDEKCKK